MATLYITSPETFSGKSALCVGLGKRFIHDGFRIGYMKPVSTSAKRSGGVCVDEDAEFVKRTFGLAEPLTALAPICLDPADVEAVLRGERNNFAQHLQDTFRQVGDEKDIMILEGGATLTEGFMVGLPPHEVSSLLDAKELVIVKYSTAHVVDDILGAKALLGESMLGAVINAVPRPKLEFVEGAVVPFLQQRGVKVYAVLPQERLLLSISVRELAQVLGGEILCCGERIDELVEHLMVGAMSIDSALSYFRRKPNKAVITGGDRPDIQLAALETSTKALILTGNLHPSPIILGRAEEVGVPIMLVRKDTLTTVEIIEQFFGRTRFHQPKKIQRFEHLLETSMNFGELYADMGIRKG
ncbi:MAG TPA: phosphotransacetylase family protein [Anaerolineae bacterium]|nr:phosphotransacetylase family protein [Anaerolineae bacterium]